VIDLYFWPTPNGYKITVALEELGLPYTLRPVDIGRGAQFEPAFLAVSPNNKMPAIVDHDPPGGGAPISVFESAAILVYLAEKTGKLMPRDLRGRTRVLEWLAWQVANQGPMTGQANHFVSYAPEKIPYAVERYTKEVRRLCHVLDVQFEREEYLAGAEYSIADVASYPWTDTLARLGIDVDKDFPKLAAWRARLLARPAVANGMVVGKELSRPLDDEARKQLFGDGQERRR
jgi:GST-like protein